jgi:hypothetical protein
MRIPPPRKARRGFRLPGVERFARIPPEVIGEAFTTPAELFRRFAGGIYDAHRARATRLEVIAADTRSSL